ncbi:hypothetical protein BGW80DRAFT_517477 [Lactifluus volemus]|nr:hypothetical protein BGW80DRAFT_517477 [Lactifluus volemus]
MVDWPVLTARCLARQFRGCGVKLVPFLHQPPHSFLLSTPSPATPGTSPTVRRSNPWKAAPIGVPVQIPLKRRIAFKFSRGAGAPEAQTRKEPPPFSRTASGTYFYKPEARRTRKCRPQRRKLESFRGAQAPTTALLVSDSGVSGGTTMRTTLRNLITRKLPCLGV